MLKTDLNTMYAVMEAFYKGKTVQYKTSPDSEWRDVTRPQPVWDPANYYYRVKTEPRMFRLWRPVYPERGEKGDWQVVEANQFIHEDHESLLVREVEDDW